MGNWTLPGEFVNEPYAYSSTCTSYDINNNLLANTSTTSCWFINKPGGKVVVGMNLLFSNGQTVSLTPEGDVSIFRPVISDFVDEPPAYVTNVTVDGTLSLSLGDGNSHGDMQYVVSVLSSYDGEFGIVQLINRNASNGSIYSDTLGTDGEFWLDTQNPYMASQVNAYLETSVSFSDSPSVADVASGLSLTTSCTDQFTDYVVFQPSGANSIWVTLGIVSGGNPSWGWSASTTYSIINGWSAPTGPPVTRPTWPNSSTAFPTWPHTYH